MLLTNQVKFIQSLEILCFKESINICLSIFPISLHDVKYSAESLNYPDNNQDIFTSLGVFRQLLYLMSPTDFITRVNAYC